MMDFTRKNWKICKNRTLKNTKLDTLTFSNNFAVFYKYIFYQDLIMNPFKINNIGTKFFGYLKTQFFRKS